MANLKEDSLPPGSAKEQLSEAPSTRRTIRLADLKGNGINKPHTTPAIKPIKSIWALPSRPAPETSDISRSSSPSHLPASPSPPKTKALNPVSASKAPPKTSNRMSDELGAADIKASPTKQQTISKVAKVSSGRPEKLANTTAIYGPLTATTLPLAVGKLFELNNYDVQYGKKIHGAEVDIVATPRGGAFGSTIYLEVTVQYVDNTKYGKDLTKFTLVREKDRSCVCISVSTNGFTPDVRERAEPSNISLRTYSELFAQFEKFAPYVEKVLANAEIAALAKSYEEPYFRDARGEQLALAWLDEWVLASGATSHWLVVLGEYGTGKTALTLKLQHDWLQIYQDTPHSPIPIRIELRNFVRQFDARSLLHHFLDSNQLGHIPVDFLLHLIRSRRVILLLDGYDEMAQFLNARERRACLAALAELAGEGAKGILTSRPNYFTEAEELHVFDALYASLEQSGYFVGQMDKLFFAQEQSVDVLLERYLINKNERYLRDLTSEQTISLVRRKLAGNPTGQQVVLNLLEKVFREKTEGRRQSLSGKPVIISYLLELVEYLAADADDQKISSFSEWQIYKLIVDRLMLRDLQRSPTMPPNKRREALQKLALQLSSKSSLGATEANFQAIVDDLFRAELRLLSPEEQRIRKDELFQDLRSSTTLTRSEVKTPSTWHFSHNSLREFFVAEVIVGSMCSGRLIDLSLPITPVVRGFVAALPVDAADNYLRAIEFSWTKRSQHGLGAYFSATFDLLRSRPEGLRTSLAKLMRGPEGRLEFGDVSLKEIEFASSDLGTRAQFICGGGILTEVIFRGLDMTESNFEGATFDRCSFIDCKLNASNFKSVLLFESNFNRVEVEGCDFSLLDNDSNIIAADSKGEPVLLAGRGASGFLKFHGAKTDDVSSFFEWQHHARFAIIQKICERISGQSKSQLRGLTQRGAAQVDPPFAREFMDCLVKAGLVEIDGNNLVSATADGRRDLPRILAHDELPEAISMFLRERR